MDPCLRWDVLGLGCHGSMRRHPIQIPDVRSGGGYAGGFLRRQHGLVWIQCGIGHGHLPPSRDAERDRPVVILAHGGFFFGRQQRRGGCGALVRGFGPNGPCKCVHQLPPGIDNVFDLETSLQEAARGCTMQSCRAFSSLMQRGQSGASTVAHSGGRLQVLIEARGVHRRPVEVPDVLTSRSKAWAEASKGTAGILVMALTCFRSSTFRARLAMQIGSRQATCPC